MSAVRLSRRPAMVACDGAGPRACNRSATASSTWPAAVRPKRASHAFATRDPAGVTARIVCARSESKVSTKSSVIS